MREYKWIFAESSDASYGESGESTSQKIFRKFPNRCLIREFTQNSIDAQSNAPNAAPVEIHVSYMQLDDATKTQMIDGVYDHVIACKKASDRNSFSKNPYDKKVEYIEACRGGKVTCLKISDYNTTGMDYKDERLLTTEEEYYNTKQAAFNACVLYNGASNKSSGRAGGSHGQGKNVGFEKSEINAIYFSTMTEPYDEHGNIRESKKYGEGVIQLCDHRIFSGNNAGFYTKNGFFGSEPGNKPDEGDNIPKCFQRNKPGTDVYIIGVYESDEDILEIKKQMLRSFFVAIKLRGIKFNLFGEVINVDNLEEKIEKYYPSNEYTNFDNVVKNYRYFFNPRPYSIKAFLNPRDDVNYIIREADEKKYTHLGAATLYLWKDEDIKLKSRIKDTIICTRDTGMVVEVRRLDSSKGFCGVLVCHGKGAEYLRLMEDVTHDEWNKEQLRDAKEEQKRIAKEAYKETIAFISDVTDELFPQIEGDEQRVPGLDSIMGSYGKDRRSDAGMNTDGEDNNEDFGLTSFITMTDEIFERTRSGEKIGTLVTRKHGGINKRVKSKLTGQKLPKEKTKKEDKDNQDEKDEKDEKITRKVDNNNSKEPDNSGTTMQEGDIDTSKRGMHSEVIPALFLQKSIHSDYGIVHRIRINVFEDYEYCSMVFYVAEMVKGSPIKVKSIKRSDFGRNEDVEYKESFTIEGIFGNTVRGFRLDKGYNYFDVKFEDEADHSLLITAYENK